MATLLALDEYVLWKKYQWLQEHSYRATKSVIYYLLLYEIDFPRFSFLCYSSRFFHLMSHILLYYIEWHQINKMFSAGPTPEMVCRVIEINGFLKEICTMNSPHGRKTYFKCANSETYYTISTRSNQNFPIFTEACPEDDNFYQLCGTIR